MNSLTVLLILGLFIESAAFALELYRHRRDSEVVRLRKREELLLDRILLLTTGAPMEVPKEEVAEAAAATVSKLGDIKKKIQDAIDEPPLPTLQDLMARAEAKSFLADAGLEPETELSAMSRSEEDLTEEQQQAQAKRKKEFFEHFQRASEEYLKQTAPVLTSQEKAN